MNTYRIPKFPNFRPASRPKEFVDGAGLVARGFVVGDKLEVHC